MLGTQPTLDASIFRTYDIRGIVGESLTAETVYAIGQALGSLVQERGGKQIAIGRDGRLSGPMLTEALSEGLRATGCDVVDVGMVPTPVLYFAGHMLHDRSCVMVTGSHNPPNYNGLKMVVNGKTLAEADITLLHDKIKHQQFLQGQGKYSQLAVVDDYIEHVAKNTKLARPLKLVIDAGNGVTGMMVSKLFKRLGCDVHELFCEVDGQFPNHHPDPSQPENLHDLIAAVKTQQADIGFAFDGDGDRLGVVTDQGEIIWPDRLLMLFAKDILAESPNAKIIYDVKCTSHLDHLIRQHDGEPIMWKTGHSLIKAKLAETKAHLAGEMSGHFFFNDRWYGFDDALYSGARLLEILAKHQAPASALFAEIPNSINTPELKVFVEEHEKFPLMQQLIDQANFAEAKDINTIDGLRVNFAEGWGLVRPSNTTPYLILRFEADSEHQLSSIQERFRDWMLSVSPELALPF